VLWIILPSTNNKRHLHVQQTLICESQPSRKPKRATPTNLLILIVALEIGAVAIFADLLGENATDDAEASRNEPADAAIMVKLLTATLLTLVAEAMAELAELRAVDRSARPQHSLQSEIPCGEDQDEDRFR
jgi:hypothetical protein